MYYKPVYMSTFLPSYGSCPIILWRAFYHTGRRSLSSYGKMLSILWQKCYITFTNNSRELLGEVVMIHVNLILTLNKYYEKTSCLIEYKYIMVRWARCVLFDYIGVFFVRKCFSWCFRGGNTDKVAIFATKFNKFKNRYEL